MNITELYKQPKLVVSFEVFPPRTAEGIDQLIAELAKLEVFQPGFISVTYGAGGSTQGRSLEVIKRIKTELKYDVLAHLTCIGSSPETILNFIDKLKTYHIKNILALRGDYPKNNPDYRPESQFFKYASDLISFVKSKTDFGVAAAGFPEIHPEATDKAADLKYLKYKVEQGAEAIITQLFFNNQDYINFVESAKKLGINVPIIPGIWILTTKAQVEKIPTLCDSFIPEKLKQTMLDPKISDEEKKKFGIDYAVKQIKDLIKYGIKGLHLYTLNRSEIVSEVLKQII